MAISARHLLLSVPEGWSNDQKGQFFERFVSDILKPLRFSVQNRIRVTGMEIDLLARALDEPRTVLVECKAQRDALPADTISKLIGNVAIRRADAGWLFSTCDLSKDGRGQWQEIQNDAELSRKFVWYPPDRLIDILLDQKAIQPPPAIPNRPAVIAGDATLVVNPAGRWWLVEILEQGVPAYFTVFDATTGVPVGEEAAVEVAKASDRFSALKHLPQTQGRPVEQLSSAPRFQVARVVAGEAWDDLRPARPADFVGRDDVLNQILQFVSSVQLEGTTTRTFAVQGPSGWGKSSLMLKLVDMASQGRRISNCSITAVDTRSATNLAFVGGAIRTALQDAAKAGLLAKGFSPTISSLTHPLDSPDVSDSFDSLRARKAVVVLIFDQFEELFAKEPLFGIFSAVRELSLDLDSKQAPLVLGFAWKTDISHPQQHPAYHLWHELKDRRLDIPIRRFGTGDIARLLTRAGKETGVMLNPALRGRLTDQCQGYPWLLKKLMVLRAVRS